jgi:hypothetical protein
MDNVDLNDLSTDVALGGKLAVPLGSTDFTIKELLDRYRPDDTLFRVGEADDGLVMLYVENVMNYEVGVLSERFDTLIDKVANYSVKTQPLDLKGVFGGELTPPSGSVVERTDTMEFDFNALNDDPSTQEIKKILFRSTEVEVRVNTYNKTYPEDFLLITMQIPGASDSIVIDASRTFSKETKTNLEIKMNKEKSTPYTIKFKITGDGTTSIATSDSINISITFKNSDYVVYGHFYYTEGKKQMDPYKVDLLSYLPEGTKLRFYAPSFKFKASSSIGVPFIFDLDAITSYAHGSPPTHVKANLLKDSVIFGATEVGKTASNTIIVDASSFPDGNASEIFTTEVDSISATYAFRAPERGSTLAEAEQFIVRDSKMSLTASVQLPLWLDTGSVIAYADTLDGIDVEEYDYITNAKLIFACTSRLPLEFGVTVTLLDKDRKEIVVTQPDKYHYTISAAEVDGSGDVSQPKESEFSISYEGSVIDDLKKAKYLKISVKAKGATRNSRIKITSSDKLSIKASLRVEGGLTVKHGKDFFDF